MNEQSNLSSEGIAKSSSLKRVRVRQNTNAFRDVHHNISSKHVDGSVTDRLPQHQRHESELVAAASTTLSTNGVRENVLRGGCSGLFSPTVGDLSPAADSVDALLHRLPICVREEGKGWSTSTVYGYMLFRFL